MSNRSKLPDDVRFWSKVDRRNDDECWPWLRAVRREDEGYGAFFFNRKNRPASRMAWHFTHGPVPEGMVVCHMCDSPSCCNPGHLFIGTPQDNDADRVRKGRQARGERNGASKLTGVDVWKIRRMRAVFGWSYAKIAPYFGVTLHAAFDACNRRWKHIDMEAMRQEFLRTNEWARRSKGGAA